MTPDKPNDRSGEERSAVVLVVEDEPLQRMEMIDLVLDAGLTPVEAWSAEHAIAILEARPDIRVVFTDIAMPGSLDGMRLAAHVRDRWPPIEIIVTSAGRAPEPEAMPARSIFIPKPLDGGRTRAALRRLVDHTS